MSVRGIRAREMAYAQWSHEQRRDAVPIDAGDDMDKVRRIETALLYEHNPPLRSLLLRELARLQHMLAEKPDGF